MSSGRCPVLPQPPAACERRQLHQARPAVSDHQLYAGGRPGQGPRHQLVPTGQIDGGGLMETVPGAAPVPTRNGAHGRRQRRRFRIWHQHRDLHLQEMRRLRRRADRPAASRFRDPGAVPRKLPALPLRPVALARPGHARLRPATEGLAAQAARSAWCPHRGPRCGGGALLTRCAGSEIRPGSSRAGTLQAPISIAWNARVSKCSGRHPARSHPGCISGPVHLEPGHRTLSGTCPGPVGAAPGAEAGRPAAHRNARPGWGWTAPGPRRHWAAITAPGRWCCSTLWRSSRSLRQPDSAS